MRLNDGDFDPRMAAFVISIVGMAVCLVASLIAALVVL